MNKLKGLLESDNEEFFIDSINASQENMSIQSRLTAKD